eukprot:TRINITY_DN1748_c5_g1_i1.p1 TRINITY_DN1748_c5_g1~~TRINITY_DN1748_c5_g1_i1.p1  ORF type:complete len:973 (+),score=306.82 TRINITY_DN1748_c5_g1_i1:114-3032(+)
MPTRLLTVLLLLAAALSVAAQTTQRAWDGVEKEALPDGLGTTKNKIVLGVSSGCVGALLVGLLITVAVTGAARMAAILLVMQLIAVLVSGICTWIVTYTAARDAIEDHTNSLLVFAGLTASSRTEADVGTGVYIAEMVWQQVQLGHVDLTAGYPKVHEALLIAESTAGRPSGTIQSVYLGNEVGEIHGVNRVRVNKTVSQTQMELWIGVGPKFCDPNGDFSQFGTAASPCRLPGHELQCGSNEDVWGTCKHKGCADTAGQCEFCLTALGDVKDDAARCPGCTKCSPYRSSVFESFAVPRDTSLWDVPPTASVEAGLCYAPSNDAAWQSGPGVVQQLGRYPNGTLSGRRYLGTIDTIASGGCSTAYDPRVRPWYARKPGLVWSAAYEFFSEGTVIEMGITATLAVANPFYSGRPYTTGVPPSLNDSPWTAVLAVDYTFTSISSFAGTLIPTVNSVILIAEPATGTLLAGSIALSEMSFPWTNALQQTVYRPVNVSNPTGWNRTDLHHVFTRISNKFGSLTNALRTRAILQGGDAIVLNQPLNIAGGLRWVMAINMPYKDVTEESEDASTTALILAVVISFGSGLIVSLVVVCLLQPLNALSWQMSDVAAMDLEGLQPLSSGITSEVKAMVRDFGTMVASLKKFREYMPQTALQGDDEDEPDDQSVGSRSRQDSMATGSFVAASPTQRGARNSFAKMLSGSQYAMSENTKRKRGAKHLDLGLKVRPVTVVYFNFRGFLEHLQSPETMVSTHADYISSILAQLRPLKGIPETFAGDRLLAHFNALQNCAGHAVKACTAVSLVTQKDPHVVAGTAAGKAHCGNLGCDGMKRFSVIGSPVCCAAMLVCLPKRGFFGLSAATSVVDNTAKKEADKNFYFRAATRLLYKKSKSTIATVWSLGEAKSAGEEEWMYQLEQAEKTDPQAQYNNAFTQFFENGTVDASVMSAEESIQFHRILSETGSEQVRTWTENVRLTDVI